VRRLDARSSDALVRLAEEAGLSLDDGMILFYGGKRYHGANALRKMALIAPANGLTNRLNRLLFGSARSSRVAYPVLRAGRNLLLRMLGRPRIHDRRRGAGQAGPERR
jgi:hypothetical protein